MSTEQNQTISASDRTLAQLALATVAEPVIPCPESSELALLIDGRVAESRQDELFHHLSACPTCYEQWRVVAEVQQGVAGKRRLGKIITLGGGLLAAAASIMLFINIQQSPMPEEMVMDDGAPVYERAEEAMLVEPVESLPSELVAPRKKMQAKKEFRPLLQAMPSESASPEGFDSMADDPFSALDQYPGETMLDINRLIPTVLQKVKRLSVGQGLEVKTYKRDRGFMLTKRSETEVEIHEFGFKDQAVILPISRLKKTLKTIIKTEFPRSNKVWLRVVTSSNN